MRFRLPRLVWGPVVDIFCELHEEVSRLRIINRRLRKELVHALKEVSETRALLGLVARRSIRTDMPLSKCLAAGGKLSGQEYERLLAAWKAADSRSSDAPADCQAKLGDVP